MGNYELYNKVIEAYKSGDEGLFNAAARNWMDNAEDANFEDEEALQLFGAAKIQNRAWRSKAINGRVSKQRMIDNVRAIAAKNLPNPYVMGETEHLIQELEEPIKVLGVLPEIEEEKAEKPAEMPAEKIEKPVEKTEKVEKPVKKEEKAEEKVVIGENEKHGLFNRKKR